MLEDEYGVKPSDINWVRGGYEQAGRIEKIALNLPANVQVRDAPDGANISDMLADGGLDANRHVLETFLRRHHAEGLSPHVLSPEELFHPSTHETHRI